MPTPTPDPSRPRPDYHWRPATDSDSRVRRLPGVPSDWLIGDDERTVHTSAKIHPSVVIGPGAIVSINAMVAEGCSIGDGCIVDRGVKIGPHSSIGSLTILALNCSVGESVEIGERCKILSDVSIGDNVAIGEGVNIGARATIGKGARIPPASVIAFDGCFPLPSLKPRRSSRRSSTPTSRDRLTARRARVASAEDPLTRSNITHPAGSTIGVAFCGALFATEPTSADEAPVLLAIAAHRGPGVIYPFKLDYDLFDPGNPRHAALDREARLFVSDILRLAESDPRRDYLRQAAQHAIKGHRRVMIGPGPGPRAPELSPGELERAADALLAAIAAGAPAA